MSGVFFFFFSAEVQCFYFMSMASLTGLFLVLFTFFPLSGKVVLCSSSVHPITVQTAHAEAY